MMLTGVLACLTVTVSFPHCGPFPVLLLFSEELPEIYADGTDIREGEEHTADTSEVSRP